MIRSSEKAGDVFPNRSGFVVGRSKPFFASEDGDDDTLGVEVERVDEVVPGELDRVALEVVAKREVAEHLEEGVMAGGHADVLEIVVLPADADALLRRGRSRVRPRFFAGEDVFELDHARVGEHEGRIIGRNERARGDPFMLAFRKEA